MNKIVLCFLFIAFLAGCATVKVPSNQYFIPAKKKLYKNSSQPTIIFYRQSNMFMRNIEYYIWEDNEIIGALKNNGYFAYQTTPGKHYYWAEIGDISSVTIDCLPNNKYYVEGSVSMGEVLGGNPRLNVVPPQVAKSRIKNLQYYDFNSSAINEQ